MDGNYVMPKGVFINQDCAHCYYKNKVEHQKTAIIDSQQANVQYKQIIKQKERRIKVLERQVHDWTKVFQSLPYPIRRWALWRYSKLN